MTIQNVPIKMMSAQALAEYVVTHMGLEVRPNMGVAAIVAKMSEAGFPTDFIEIDDGKEAPPPVKRVEPQRGRKVPGRRSVQIRIEPQEKPGGSEPVFTSVNGKAMWIPRAKTCWINYPYYEVLKNAVAHIAITDEESKIIGYRKVPEYPVSVFHIEPRLTAEEKKLGEEMERKRAAEEEARRREEEEMEIDRPEEDMEEVILA